MNPFLWKRPLWAPATALALLACVASGQDLASARARGTLRVLSASLAGSAGGPLDPAADRPGFEREMLEGFARLQHVGIEIVPVKTYDELVPALLAGRGDMIAGVFTVTEGRKRQIDFTVETFPTRNLILSRRPRPVIQTLAQLHATPRIGALQAASDWQALLDAGVPPSALVSLVGDGIEGLRTGHYDAVIQQVETAIAGARADPELQIGMYLGPPGSYAFGVRKEAADLRESLSQYIVHTRRSGGWNRLVVKYYGAHAAEVLAKIRE